MIVLVIGSLLVVTLIGIVLNWSNYQTTPETSPCDDGRPLGSFERFTLDISELCGFNMAVVAICTLSRPVTLIDMSNVLQQIMKKHPLLRVKIEYLKKTQKPWFIPVEDLAIDVEELPASDWSDVLEDQLSSISVDVTKAPSWKVKFFQDSNTSYADGNHKYQFVFMFIASHVICDGFAAHIIINDIVSGIKRQISGIADDSETVSLPFPQSLENMILMENRRLISLALLKRLYNFLEKYLQTIGETYIPREQNIWLHKFGSEISRDPTIRPTTSILPMTFSKMETSTLINACRMHNVSPLAVLQAASLIVLGQELSIPDTEVEFGCTVSSRKSAAKSPDDIIYQQIASYVSFLPCKVTTPEDLDNPDFWAMVEACRTAVHDNLNKRYQEQMHQDTYLHTGFKNKEIFHKINIRSKELVVYNNLGKMAMFKNDFESLIQLKEVFGGTAQHSGSWPLFNITSAYFSSQFCWHLVFYPNIVSKKTAKRIAKKTQELIMKQSENLSEKVM